MSYLDVNSSEQRVRLLHVDDEPDFAELTSVYLQRELDSIRVLTEHTAADGLDRLDDADVDCIVSDYQMPGKNGLEFLDEVREEYPDLPFVLFTGQGSEEVASDAISAGVTDYLQKEGGTDQYTVLANRVNNAVNYYRSQQALEASEVRLSLFIDQSPLGVIEWDEEFNFVRINRTGESILGHAESDLEGNTWETIVPEQDQDHVDAVVTQLLENKGGYHSINENVTKDGGTIICEWHNRVVTDDDDEVVAIFSQFQDVTERERHKRRLETLIKNLPGIAYRCRNEPDWPMEFVSGECESLTGYEASALESDEVNYGVDIIHPEDRDMVDSDVQESLENNEPFELTYRIRTKAGDQKWVWERGRGVRSSDEEIEWLEGFISDITARKEYEAELELKDRAMDAAPIGILITDPAREDNPIIHANDQFLRLTGYDEDEVLGRNCRFLQGENTDSKPVAEMHNAIDKQKPVTVELLNYRKDGTEFWNRVSIAPVENDEGEVTHFVGFQQDITEWIND